MPWWSWVLIWVVVVLAAAGVLALLGFSLWRRLKALYKEIEIATEKLSIVAEEIERLNAPSEEPAVFADPVRLRQDRYLSSRERGRRRAAG